ncbi:MAG TPA: protein-L-isoaspartate(D-aspartate) O-methyltransferase [Anaerolineaceae bacterium]|nr:protein-L-isoaspartate(D-aspartate) O-methyltransferase [Anaerolineaceae bacterium]
MDIFFDLRQKMVAEQIEARGIRDPRVLEAMRQVPRHRFVNSENWDHAYADGPLPTGFGQTISQPYIVALMTSLLHLQGSEKVLEIGTGSGYQAAILALLAREVFTVELYPELAERAEEVLRELGASNVRVIVADGSGGLPDLAPFQGILTTAAAPQVPLPLLEQLDLHGRLVIPVGDSQGQDLQVWEREPESGYELHQIAPVAFVPLRGTYGWKESEWKPR